MTESAAVARALSVVEAGGEAALALIDELLPRTGRAMVVGVTGPPGAGKSTLVDAMIVAWRAHGRTVAVLAVDPSSPLTGGALLGDRLRMRQHATDAGVFVRSLADRGHGGGLAACTPDAVRVLDAAGFDVVVIETVGVGQSEVEIVGVADETLLVVVPGVGDAVQSIKSGLLDVAGWLVVNRGDQAGADRTCGELRSSLRLRGSPARLHRTIATTGDGVAALVAAVTEAWAARSDLSVRRGEAALAEARRRAAGLVAAGLRARPLPESLQLAVRNRQTSPGRAAQLYSHQSEGERSA